MTLMPGNALPSEVEARVGFPSARAEKQMAHDNATLSDDPRHLAGRPRRCDTKVAQR